MPSKTSICSWDARVRTLLYPSRRDLTMRVTARDSSRPPAASAVPARFQASCERPLGCKDWGFGGPCLGSALKDSNKPFVKDFTLSP